VLLLGRTKTSNRNATCVLAAAAESLGHSPSSIVLNRESIRKARRQHRETAAKELQASFTPNCLLIIHWDGKMLPALESKESVERLAVLVSGDRVMKLLGVPKLPNGTREAEAIAVFNLVQECNLTDRIKFMSFDTTARGANPGGATGAIAPPKICEVGLRIAQAPPRKC